VLLISKDELGGGSTPLAQVAWRPPWIRRTRLSCTRRTRWRRGPAWVTPGGGDAGGGRAGVISWLSSLGAELGYGHLEGGHSRRRIVHAGATRSAPKSTGCSARPCSRATLGWRRTRSRWTWCQRTACGRTAVCWWAGLSRGHQRLSVGLISARAIVLATGGYGQAFATTTNPPGVTGDGLALAVRAGAAVRDLEFVQFHPTVLWSADASGQCPLITEALRGAGRC